MSWQRFNRTSNVFEVSDDNGASWQTLVIAAGGLTLPSGIAYLNAANTFTAYQKFSGGSGTLIHSSPIEIILASHPRVGFHWPGVVASSIGMDSAGVIRTYDNPGTGYERFACLNIYAASTSNNLGDLTCRGGTNFQGGLYVSAGIVYLPSNTWHVSTSDSWERIHFTHGGPTYLKGPSVYIRNNSNTDIGIFASDGQFTASGSIGSNLNQWRSNLHNVNGYLYPGRADAGGAYQASWYLGGHASYGLYSNTGLRVEGVLQCGNVFSAAYFRSCYGRAALAGDTVYFPNSDGICVLRGYCGPGGQFGIYCDAGNPPVRIAGRAANATNVGDVEQTVVCFVKYGEYMRTFKNTAAQYFSFDWYALGTAG
jgi:hypothetical protein